MPISRQAITPLAKPVRWSVRVPGSKSFMNRAVLCAALARGKSIVRQPVYCDDTNYLISALRGLGVRFEKKGDRLIVHGVGGEWCTPRRPLVVGNAGTTLRFLVPHLPAGTSITGDARMQKRPIADLVSALRELGFRMDAPTGCPPVTMQERSIHKNTIHVRGDISSQYLSALLMLAPTLTQGLRIQLKGKLVSTPYVEMTLAVMKAFGIIAKRPSPRTFFIAPQRYRPTTYTIEGDASSATYWWALAAIARSKITVANISPKTLQPDIRFLKYLKRMGCNVDGTTVIGPWGGPQFLRRIQVNMNETPDAVMSLAVVAACATGRTIITGIHHLATKESDRLQALAFNLRRLGVSARASSSALQIIGSRQPLWSDVIDPQHDHRLAMAFAMLGLVHRGIRIAQPECVKKSYPTFWRDVRVVQRQARRQTIILTGLRATGKTTLGKRYAKKWECGFIDLDELIEQRIKQPLGDYVVIHGWRAFRRVEHRVWKVATKRRNVVVATGGGTLMDTRNVRLLTDHYVVVLTAPLGVVERRLQADTDRARPVLFTGSISAASELKRVWRERKKRYLAVADTIYDSR